MENNNFSAGSKLIVDFFLFSLRFWLPDKIFKGEFSKANSWWDRKGGFFVKDNSNKREEAWKRISLLL